MHACGVPRARGRDSQAAAHATQEFPANESQQEQQHIARFSESSISTTAKAITILVAANLLVGSIYGLYFASTPLQRLGLIQAFTTVFALCAGFMTHARRAELFAVTAA